MIFIRNKLRTIIMNVVIVFSFFIMFFSVNACPHFDEDGNLYFMLYDDANYETTIILYPKDYHNRLTYYDYYGDKMYEEFEIYLFQRDNMYDPQMDNEKMTVQGLKKLFFKKDNYTITVPVQKAYNESRTKISDNVHSIFYNLQFRNVNKKMYKNEYLTIKNIFEEFGVNYIGADILITDLSTISRFSTTAPKKDSLKEYIEPITLTVDLGGVYLSEDDIRNLVAVKVNVLGDDNFSMSNIEGIYNEEDNTFTFTINEIGIYSIVTSSTEIDPNKTVYVESVEDDLFKDIIYVEDKNDSQKIIFISIIVVCGIILFAIMLKKDE